MCWTRKPKLSAIASGNQEESLAELRYTEVRRVQNLERRPVVCSRAPIDAVNGAKQESEPFVKIGVLEPVNVLQEECAWLRLL